MDNSNSFDDEEARCALERASTCTEKGDLYSAMSLLERAERLQPSARGLPEIMAVTEVCYAATWSPSCACSSSRQQDHPPHWYRILKVDEKADTTAIKKRYRQLALLLHPDKNKHARAEEAFKLVSEAYAILSDKNRRAIFDLELRKRQCKKCSLSQIQNLGRESSRCFRESLKEKSQTSFHNSSVPPAFHSAEWNQENERLRMFRERAQAKVDSLAQILKDRRARWTEEKARYQRTRCSTNNKDDWFENIVQRCERAGHKFQSLDPSHPYSRTTNVVPRDRNGSDDSKIMGGGGLSLMGKRILEEIKTRKTKDKWAPQVLETLDGLLEILRDEIGGNNSAANSKRASTKDTKHASYFAKETSAESYRQHQKKKDSFRKKYGSEDKFDEEFTVIDDFLSGLSECLPEKFETKSATDSHFMPSSNIHKENSTPTRMSTRNMMYKNGNDKATSRYDQGPLRAMPHENLRQERWSAREEYLSKYSMDPYSEKQKTKYYSQSDPFTSNKPHASSLHINNDNASSRMRESFSDSKSLREAMHHRKASNAAALSQEIPGPFQNQKKKSEHLLKTLERLREETKSIAATLESIKEMASTETHHMNGMFTGNCCVPSPASIIAT